MSVKSKNRDILKVTPSIIELNETSSDIFMTMTMCILTNQVNLNDLEFTEDYIDGIVNNKDVYIGIPLQVNRFKLENGLYNSLTHEFDKKTGQLLTDSVGSFVDFWKDTDDDGTIKLMGSVKIYKRYPNVCAAVVDLYESGDLEFSCEMYAYGYAETNEETGVRKVNYEHKGIVNSLFASCIVTYAAEVKSKADLLIAEAVYKDLDSQGGENVTGKPVTEVFNKGVEVQYHGKLELASLKFEQVRDQIYNLLNPIDPKKEYREYNYYITDMYTDFCIAEDWHDYKTLYKIGYKIENDIVQLESEDKWVKGYRGFIPEGITLDDLLSQVSSLTVELNELKSQHKEELETMSDENKDKVTELEAKIAELNSKIDELNGTIVAKQEEINGLQEKETELNQKVAELTPYKEKVELAEKQAKQTELSAKYSKLLSAEVQASDDYKTAIEELNRTALNELVVAEVSKVKVVETNSKTEDPEVIVSAAKQDDLLPQGVLQKYGISD